MDEVCSIVRAMCERDLSRCESGARCGEKWSKMW